MYEHMQFLFYHTKSLMDTIPNLNLITNKDIIDFFLLMCLFCSKFKKFKPSYSYEYFKAKYYSGYQIHFHIWNLVKNNAVV